MKEFFEPDILQLDQRYRAMFINSLGGFKSLMLIGTRSTAGNTNLATFSSFFHLGADPALFGIILRPGLVERHTLNNIMATGEFTVNHVHADIYTQAHQCSARYPELISEFSATGLTELYVDGCVAPFVEESLVRIGARLVRKVDIEENGTTMLIAAIRYVAVPGSCIMTDGFIDIEKAGSLTCSGLDSYHVTEQLSRLTYAKPDNWPEILDVPYTIEQL